MIKIDLITGFLGSGKTTFLKKYAQYLMDQGQNIAILENDFGAVNVDMMLLQDLEGDNCELEMIAGGCDAETHRRRFRTKLIAMGMLGYDRLLVEPSGIYDVDEFFDTLQESPLDQWYKPGSVITILDASAKRKETEKEAYLNASEAAHAGIFLLSKTGDNPEEDRLRVLEEVNQDLRRFGCERQIEAEEVLAADWTELTKDDYERIRNSGYRQADYRKIPIEEEGFQSLCFLNQAIAEPEIETLCAQLFEDPDCGTVFRIKGFFRREDGSWLELNSDRSGRTVREIPRGQEVFIVIGENLSQEKIQEYLNTVQQ